MVVMRSRQVEVDESTLSPEEQKERKIMKLLLKIKNGTPPMRKVSVSLERYT
jgi:splicing factor 3B subunit 1